VGGNRSAESREKNAKDVPCRHSTILPKAISRRRRSLSRPQCLGLLLPFGCQGSLTVLAAGDANPAHMLEAVSAQSSR
jgi:hypothetical protein